MATIRVWLTKAKSQLTKGYLGPNLIFGSILDCMEKLVEVEFECPCNPKLNRSLVAGYFLVPAIFVFVVMSIQGYKNRKRSKGWKNSVLMGVAQAWLWIILLFIDGNYYACGMTDWLGRYVDANEADLRKWCKPANKNSSEELLIKTEYSYFLSQVIGMWLIVFLIFATAVYVCKTDENKEGPDSSAVWGQAGIGSSSSQQYLSAHEQDTNV